MLEREEKELKRKTACFEQDMTNQQQQRQKSKRSFLDEFLNVAYKN